MNQDLNNKINNEPKKQENDFEGFSIFLDEIYNINNTPQKIEKNYKNYYPTQNNKKTIDEIFIVYKKSVGKTWTIQNTSLFYNQTVSEDKIFGEIFVQNNRNNCKIIYNRKEYRLCSYLKEVTNEFIDNQFSIKLKGISK
jgi:hypothetical protein